MNIKFIWHIVFVVIALVVLFVFITKYKTRKKMILKAYNTDPLTGLVSSSTFFRKVAPTTLLNAKPMEFEIISFDIDYFKTLNSYYSLEKANEILVAVANAIKEAFAGTSATYTRKTADQFVILNKISDGVTAKYLYVSHIIPAIQKIIGKKYNWSFSFGIFRIINTKEQIIEMVSYADLARAKAKKRHGTSFVLFDDAMKKTYDSKTNITFRMEKALADKEFYVVYQPKINFRTLKIAGAEAFVRWKQKFGENIYPDEFIKVFEDNGFIFELDMYVLQQVCKCIKLYCRKMNLPTISVNLSAISVFDENIITKINAITEEYGIYTHEIEFEITESAIITNEKDFLKRIRQIKKLGFAISVDDFGAGISSLNRLSLIDADVIKLDKAFFNIKDRGEKSQVVVECVIKMAKKLGMKIVAEGVENACQAQWLKKQNCDYAQGYFFEKPLEENDFICLLKQNKTYELK